MTGRFEESLSGGTMYPALSVESMGKMDPIQIAMLKNMIHEEPLEDLEWYED